jgi:hypothetical protein
MAEFNTNLTPNIKTTSLGDMINMASGLQSFQQAQQMNPLALQKAQIENQTLQQANQERVALQQFTSNPENWQTNGRIDMDKINSAIPKIAPLTGSKVITELSGLHKSQTDASTAKQNLTQSQREIIANRTGLLGRLGVQDPKIVLGELNRLKEENPDSPELYRLIDAYSGPLNKAQPGKHISDDMIRLSQSMLSPAQQQEALSPKVGTMDVGPGFQPYTQQPFIGGQQPSIQTTGTVIPKDISPGIIEISGVKYYQKPSTTGGSPTLTPVGEAGAAPAAPMAAAPATAPAAQATGTQRPLIVEDMPVPRTAIPQLNDFQKQRYESGTNLIKESVTAANAATEGEETSRQVKNYMGAATGSAPGQFLRKAGQWVAGDPQLEILSKNLADQQLRNMQIMGAKTDAASADVKAASGKADLTREGLQAIVDRTDASNAAVKAFQKGLKRYTDQGLNGIVHAEKFQQAWADNYDVRVFKAMNIMNSNMPQAQKQLEQQKLLKGLSDSQLKDLQEKATNIERLQNGGR